MKNKYTPPEIYAYDIDTECCLCTGSSTIEASRNANDLQEEWEIGNDDERFTTWQP